MTKQIALFLVAFLNKEVAHAFSLSCSGQSPDQRRSKACISLNMKPVGSGPQNPFIDRILSKKQIGPSELFSTPASTNSVADHGLSANVFLRPDANQMKLYPQPSLFPRSLSLGTRCRDSRTQLNLSTLSCLRISPLPHPLGQGRHHQHLLSLRKKAKLSSLILLAQVFEKEINVVNKSNHKVKKRRSGRKRLVKNLFSNRSRVQKEKISIVRMKDLTNLPKEGPSSLSSQGDQDEMTVFDLDLAALTTPRELPIICYKVAGNNRYPPFPKMTKRKIVPIAATWKPLQVKPAGILRNSSYQGQSGIATILALGGN